MKIDVFVSYHAASARNIAEAVVNKLEQQGLCCWYQDRDTGGYFADVIKRAIDECGVFVVLLNQGACRSRYIRSEVSLAYDRDEVEILPLRLENVKLSDALDYYLHGIHWIDAVNRSLDAALDDLSRRTLKALNKTAPRSKIETIKYDDGCIYTGEVVDGKRHGEGKMTWPNGDVYEGDFVGDERHGKGRYVWGKNSKWAGDVYEGDFVNGIRAGKGKYTWKDGDIYEGDFVNDELNGTGTYTYADGSVQSGKFLNGVFQG